MPGAGTAYFPNLTGVRGLAALWVLMYHAWQFANGPALVLPLPGVGLDLTPLFKCGYFGAPSVSDGDQPSRPLPQGHGAR